MLVRHTVSIANKANLELSLGIRSAARCLRILCMFIRP